MDLFFLLGFSVCAVLRGDKEIEHSGLTLLVLTRRFGLVGLSRRKWKVGVRTWKISQSCHGLVTRESRLPYACLSHMF